MAAVRRKEMAALGAEPLVRSTPSSVTSVLPDQVPRLPTNRLAGSCGIALRTIRLVAIEPAAKQAEADAATHALAAEWLAPHYAKLSAMSATA